MLCVKAFQVKSQINIPINIQSTSAFRLVVQSGWKLGQHFVNKMAEPTNREKIQGEIKAQGELVRKLKTEKAEKDKVFYNYNQ